MDVQVRSKSQEKRGHVLALRGDEVTLLTLSGNAFTLKKKLKDAIEKIMAGVDPARVGTGSVKRLAFASIAKAEISPGNSSLTLRGEGEKAPSLCFRTFRNFVTPLRRPLDPSTIGAARLLGRTWPPWPRS